MRPVGYSLGVLVALYASRRRFAQEGSQVCASARCGLCYCCIVACGRDFDEAHKKVPKANGPARVAAVAEVGSGKAGKGNAMWSAQPVSPRGEVPSWKRSHGSEDAGGKKLRKITCYKCGKEGHFAKKCPDLS